MDSLLFAKGPQMGNKMFPQLFNVKNIHFRAQILHLVRMGLSRLCVRVVRGRQATVHSNTCSPDCWAGTWAGLSPGHWDVPSLCSEAVLCCGASVTSGPSCAGTEGHRKVQQVGCRTLLLFPTCLSTSWAPVRTSASLQSEFLQAKQLPVGYCERCT